MIRLGVTGHRPHRLHIEEARLSARVRAVLEALICAAGGAGTGPVIDVQSPLAEGADRIVAREALALDQQLTALLPLSPDGYEATFADEVSRLAFRNLLAKSVRQRHVGSRDGGRQSAYVAVGQATVARSDLVLTIWDGKPAEGPGGTPEILQSALDANVPVIWIDAARDREPMLLRADPRDQGAACVAITIVARRAKPLTEAACRALVAAVASGRTRQGK